MHTAAWDACPTELYVPGAHASQASAGRDARPGVTTRSRLLVSSTAYTAPDGPTTTSVMPAKVAAEAGPSAAAARRALARGWALPLAWDDDEIDDPAATPCLDSRTTGFQVSLEVMLEDFEHTRGEHGGNMRLAAERLGVSRGALERALHRARAAGVEVNFFHDRRTA